MVEVLAAVELVVEVVMVQMEVLVEQVEVALQGMVVVGAVGLHFLVVLVLLVVAEQWRAVWFVQVCEVVHGKRKAPRSRITF